MIEKKNIKFLNISSSNFRTIEKPITMENFFTHYSFNDYTYVALQVGRSLYDDSVLEIRQIDEKK